MAEEKTPTDSPLTVVSKFLNNSGNLQSNERDADLMTVMEYFIFLKASVAVRTAICLLGIGTNALNIRAFYRIGLDDSLTIVLCGLALSDFLNMVSTLLYVTLTVTGIVERELQLVFPLPPTTLGTLIAVASRAFTEVTNLTTVFLALQRCMCVALPLQFKGIFTLPRVIIVMTVIWACPVIITATLLSQHELVKMFDPSLNATRFAIRFRSGRQVMADLVYTMFGIVLNTTNQIVVLACVFVLANALTKSVRFRQKASSGTVTSDASATTGNDPQKEKRQGTLGADASKVKELAGSLSNTKEKQAIIQVALVSTIFLVCNTPHLAGAFAHMLDPRLDTHGQFHLFFTTLYVTNTIFENINSSVNFFVYYRYNSKFRSVCFRASVNGK